MSSVINVKKLDFSYENKVIFSNFNLEIEKGEFVSLIGPNGSGKSTFVKLLAGLLNYQGSISIFDYELKSNVNSIRKNMGIMFGSMNDQSILENVFDVIAFPLINLNYNKEKIIDLVYEISNKLGIYHLLDRVFSSLSNMEKTLVNLASILVYKPQILIFDGAFVLLDRNETNKILSILQSINMLNQTTIINVTQNGEDLLYSNKIIILDNGKIICHDYNDSLFKSEKIFSKLGLDLPFMIDLSIKLKYYNLIDEPIYSMEEMVDILWK